MNWIRKYLKRRLKRKAARRLVLLREVIRSDSRLEYGSLRRQVADEMKSASFAHDDKPRPGCGPDETVARYHIGRHNYELLQDFRKRSSRARQRTDD